jgi:hypothetical protein
MASQTIPLSTKLFSVFEAPSKYHFVTDSIDTLAKTIRLFQRVVDNSRIQSYVESIAYKIPFVNQVLGIADFFADLNGLKAYLDKNIIGNQEVLHAWGTVKKALFVLCDVLFIISFTCIILPGFASISSSVFIAIQTIVLINLIINIGRTLNKTSLESKKMEKQTAFNLRKSEARVDLLQARLWRNIYYTALSIITMASFVYLPATTLAANAGYVAIVGLISMVVELSYYSHKAQCKYRMNH